MVRSTIGLLGLHATTVVVRLRAWQQIGYAILTAHNVYRCLHIMTSTRSAVIFACTQTLPSVGIEPCIVAHCDASKHNDYLERNFVLWIDACCSLPQLPWLHLCLRQGCSQPGHHADATIFVWPQRPSFSYFCMYWQYSVPDG